MSIAQGTFSLKCSTPNCGNQYDFPQDDAEFEITSSNERQMGPENQYSWEFAFDCDNCKSEIEVTYEVWEYPAGAFNMDEINIVGGTEVTKYSYDFIGEPDDIQQDERD